MSKFTDVGRSYAGKKNYFLKKHFIASHFQVLLVTPSCAFLQMTSWLPYRGSFETASALLIAWMVDGSNERGDIPRRKELRKYREELNNRGLSPSRNLCFLCFGLILRFNYSLCHLVHLYGVACSWFRVRSVKSS